MLQPLQIRDVSSHYAGEIAELREFLAKAGLPLDTAETLHGVATRLRDDRAFRRDLTSHAWVLIHGGGRQVRHADLLAMLAIAAAGPRFAAEAADTDAHDLLRFVMQVWNSFDAAPGPLPERHTPRPAAPVVLSSTQPRYLEQDLVAAPFTRGVPPDDESTPTFEMPHEVEDPRRILWIGGAAAACVLLALGTGLLLRHHEPATSGAPVTSTAAPSAVTHPPQVLADGDEALPAQQRGEATAAAARRPSHVAPYSPLPESARDLPEVASNSHGKPSPAIPMTSTRPAIAAVTPMPVRPRSTPYARSSRPAAASQPATSASTGASFVPKAVPVTTLGLHSSSTSAGTTRQAIVRPTSLGIMAANVMYSPVPPYPRAASNARVQGEVKLEAEVGRDGTVESTRIISGPPLLADAAADAVQHWRYRPYLYEGKPIAMNAQIVMDFQLP